MGNSNRIKAGVIGVRGHAQRLQKILSEHPDVDLHCIFHPEGRFPEGFHGGTRCFEDVLECDCVFISSPTPTHHEYLERLKDFPGYIWVEKPGASSLEECQFILNLPESRKQRIQISYNLRNSDLLGRMKGLNCSDEIGKASLFSVRVGHGLAFTDGYLENWRNSQDSSFGVLELLGVHYIDLALACFGELESIAYAFSWGAGQPEKSTPDTCSIQLNHKQSTSTQIFLSYAIPKMTEFELVGNNGYWVWDGSAETVYSPRDTFDSNGRFTVPPCLKSASFQFSSHWEASLVKSVDRFVSAVSNKTLLSPTFLDQSILPAFYVYQLRKRYFESKSKTGFIQVNE